MARRRPPRATNLLNLCWRLPDGALVRVTSAMHDQLAAIDVSWPARRPPTDVQHAWRWSDIVPDMREAFIMTIDDRPAAVWSTKVGGVELEGRTFYRLDYLELDPDRRGDGQTAAALFGLIAKRVAEHRAEGVVLAAFNEPKLLQAYEYLGAEQGAPRGWNHPPGLVPLTFKQSALDRLRELIDGLEEKSSGTVP